MARRLDEIAGAPYAPAVRVIDHLRLLIAPCYVAMLLGSLPGATGCESKGYDGGGANSAAMDGAWLPRPVAIRIYPSTRFVRDQGVPLLEARFELFDAMGDSLKSSGQVRFELFASAAAPGVEVGRLLYSWDLTLTDLEDQRRYYDPITRGYLMRLRMESPRVQRGGVMLRTTFQPPTGQRLVDEKAVRTAG